jgi:hypothetical protein
MKSKYEQALIPRQYYHISNRGNNREVIFLEPRNYAYILRLYINMGHRLRELTLTVY